ncbi:MAG: transporter [Deltaproteobacteria bacterium]|nr:transporter [Deltaproteobacteria bacterium]
MKKYLSIFLLATFFIVSLTGLSFSCDYCMLSQGLSPLQTTTGIGLRVDERYTTLNKMFKGTSEVDNPGNEETHLTTQITGFYAINPDLTALVIVPYVQRTMKEWDDVEMTFMKGKASGLGDIVLMGRYTFYRRHELDSTTIVAGQVGVKLPTGATNAKDDMGMYMDAHMQPGTGSYDYLLGLNLSHAIGRFTIATNLLYSINNEGKKGKTGMDTGDEKHQFGNMFSYDATGIYRIYPATPPGPTVSLALGVAGEWRDKEKIDGVTQDGSEGHVIYLNTGLLFIPHPQWIVELNYRPAIYHDLPANPTTGETQMGEDYKATLSVSHLF